MEKVIALVDCNNFYVSCERLFKPKYIGKPLVVLSNNDGCAVSRSNEAKTLGIAMGAPLFTFKDICKQHNVILHSSNYELYGDLSNRVMTIITEAVSEIEIYSIDEAFIDLTGIQDPFQFCVKLREKILKWIGIPVSIGISTTKTLAKVAGDLAKKDKTGVFQLLNNSEIDQILISLPIEDIWGIGRQISRKLKSMFKINYALQLKRYDAKLIRKHFSVVLERMVYELNGLSCLQLEEISPKKSIATTRSFGRTITNYNELSEAIASFAVNAGVKLRRQNSKVQSLYVFIRTSPFKDNEQYCAGKLVNLIYPTSDSSKLIKAAINGLKLIYKENLEYKKGGVILVNIVSADYLQHDILEPYNNSLDQKSKALMDTLDKLNHKFGKSTVLYAAQGFKQNWQPKSELMSKRYTTRFEELATVI